MEVKDFTWKKGMTVKDLADNLSCVGFQSVELSNATNAIAKMKKSGAKIYLTFTSNMVTSGLRGFFAQIIRLGLCDCIVTTTGAIEEDIMKAMGEKFKLGQFKPDDIELHERGVNRVGNILITSESYCKFEEKIKPMLQDLYKKSNRWSVSGMLREFGKMFDDENSILSMASRHNVPIFCPSITDGSLGFHLFMFQQEKPDFVVDVVMDFKNILFSTTQDDLKGLISLGGGVSKHHAILACLLNGGVDYAVYLTTARHTSGSMSGATTDEAKSWGKIKDDSDAATVVGDVSITFPLAMIKAMEILSEDGIISTEDK